MPTHLSMAEMVAEWSISSSFLNIYLILIPSLMGVLAIAMIFDKEMSWAQDCAAFTGFIAEYFTGSLTCHQTTWLEE